MIDGNIQVESGIIVTKVRFGILVVTLDGTQIGHCFIIIDLGNRILRRVNILG